MALTPDDLLNKEFPETKFRPGYDKDEVDDFLDEVVVEWRRLIQENEDLQAQVTSLEEQIEENPSNLEPDDLKDAGLSGYAGTSAEVTGTFAPISEEQDDAEQDDAEPLVQDSSVTAHPEYVPGTRPAQRRPEPEGPAETPAGPATPGADDANSAAGVLAMAQKLHDQYVAEGEQTRAAYIAEGEQTRAQYIAEGEQTRAQYISEGEQKREELVSEGQAKRDELIAEGEQTREQYITEAERKRQEIVTEAETRANNMIEEAELTSSRTLSALERKKADLEGKVTELTSFERDYRARLKDYIEGQLKDLNSRGSIEKETTGAE